MSSSEQTIKKFNEHVMGTYGRYSLVMDSGNGETATDENGKKVFSDELLHKRFNSVKNRTGLKKRIKYQCFNLRIKGNRIKKNIKYTIIINSKNIYWFEKKSLGSDFYDGDLYIDNKKQPGDLLLSMKGI